MNVQMIFADNAVIVANVQIYALIVVTIALNVICSVQNALYVLKTVQFFVLAVLIHV